MAKTPQNKKALLNLAVLVLFLVSIFAILQLTSTLQEKPQSFSQLVTDIREGKVSKIEISSDQTRIKGEIYKNPNAKDRANVEKKDYVALQSADGVTSDLEKSLGQDEFKKLIGTQQGEVTISVEETPWIQSFLNNGFVQTIIIVGILVLAGSYYLQRITDTNNKSLSFGQTRAKFYDKKTQKDQVTFEDVAGNIEAKQELTEVVDFLRRSEEYIKMGARIPRGVLLIGSPGNGKTLMARAIAGEAKVPFLYVSGSEFVEMLVGVGASRVRSLFSEAKKKSPCVIFIDEIDAVGRQRGTGLGGGNDEREQTLNQILVEMDGFEPSASVIVIAATNRPDVLDPALLRPGRFDRQVTVTSPDRGERLKILEVHSKNKKFTEDANLDIVARRTAGFSGADLMNVLNEAAILTVRENKPAIDNDILREAIDKSMLGPSLRSKFVSDEQKKLTAYHEAGHALTATVMPKARKVQKISIIPRGRAGGYTFPDYDDNDSMTRTQTQFLTDIVSLFGGYTVEQEVFGEISTGASNDLAKATGIARDMVTKYGMSALGPMALDEDKGLSFLGRDMMEGKHYSEDIARQIDQQIRDILDYCLYNCRQIIIKYRKELDEIADHLLEKEILEYEEFKEITAPILDTFKLIKPKSFKK
jgi:cell division protease FtsH